MKETWQHIEVTDKKVREFGYVIFVVVGLIFPLLSSYKNDWAITDLGINLFGGSALFLLLCRFATRRMYTVYKLWMLLAVGLGFIMTRVIISLVYLLMITPIGLIRRIKGNNVSDTFHQFDRNKKQSYWIVRTDSYDSESTERQY